MPRLKATPPGIRGLGLAPLLGVLAGLALRPPSALISPADGVDIFYSRNIAALGLPFLAIYLAVRSHAFRSARGGLSCSSPGSPTSGSRRRDLEARMDRLRFLGESIIHSAILWMATVVVDGVIMPLFITVVPEDLVLILVMAIVVLTVSARDPLTPARPLDRLQPAPIVGAIAAPHFNQGAQVGASRPPQNAHTQASR